MNGSDSHANGSDPHGNGPRRHVRIAIIGTGFSGLGMAIRLKQKGIEDFVLLERAGDIGGTWRDNTYPGCQCDIPSHLYSFSFAANPNWSRTYSRQQEIWDYLRDCARRFDVLPHVLFNHDALDATWNEDEQVWKIETSAGDLTANVLVAGMGPLSEPRLPDVPGIESFEGTAFHSAQWNHDYDLTGKRVAVVGTGASAVQLLPRIQPKVASLHLFQRTPAWVMPHSDRPITRAERWLYRRFPALQRFVRGFVYWSHELLVFGLVRNPKLMRFPQRIAMRHLESAVADPELRAKLTPDYTVGCKRILPSNDYYPALTKPNVEVVTGGLREIRGSTVVAADGTEREVDAIIFGTGFQVTDMPIAKRVRGRGGKLLDDVWQGSPQAYLGAAVTGFPNMFVLTGPNTGLGHNSMVFMIESQLEYILDCLAVMDERGIGAVDVRPETQAAYNERIQDELKGTVWSVGGCSSWYIDRHGRNSTLYPDFTFRFRRLTERFDPADYTVEPRTPAREPAYA